MTFVETRFPDDIAYGSVGGPEFSTDVIIMQSGYEQRNVNWSNARARYNVAHGVKTQTQLDELIAFFRARKGRAEGFRFKDWTDFASNGEAVGIADGSATVFQLKKTYSNGGVDEVRNVSKPVVGSVVVYADAVVVNEADYTLNSSNGQITFDSAPTNGVVITADFEFDVPARFDVDRLSATIETYGVHSWSDISIVEIRV